MSLRSHSEQFSRWSDVILDFVREDRQIFRTLLSRLPADLQKYAARYHRFHRGTQYMHTVIHAAMKGRWRAARQVLGEISHDWSAGIVFALWLSSVNRRLFSFGPRYLPPTVAHSSNVVK